MKGISLFFLVATFSLVFGPAVCAENTTYEFQYMEISPYSVPWRFGGQGSVGSNSQEYGEEYIYLNLTTVCDNRKICLSELSDWTYYGPQSSGDLRWLYSGIDIKLRCSDDNKLSSDVGGGSRWWGLISNRDFGSPPKSGLAFGSMQPGSDEEGFGLRSYVNGALVFSQPLTGVDMREWHTYTIIWEVGKATWLVDGKVVGSTREVPSEPLGAEMYITNAHRIDGRGVYAALTTDSSMIIDRVNFFPVLEPAYISILGLLLLSKSLRRRC